ncbi:histidine phosphatase family protein [Sulfoacidibacillus ferrooxidans]|uniref:Adenosylcobalamin/alpha-ribazole phosphatase n=1 Tax=Sulfoacidibacillus ferrooxidans TaxID=2005001 RepID=A0A9X2AE42_9BACL|nr:histidine phosphatase family protein [Sulfoacidibacillus ferrooxidans]MCI0182771.1 Adenosylcobalamin/alpha-ribazole phosphatase [Sulfoacidibacillus ferrooxidans]
MPSHVIFVRHAQTVDNVQKRYLGHRDSPLSALGKWQEERILDLLYTETIDAVFGSDLLRAASLAQRIAHDHHVKAQLTPDLREMNFGVFEGLTYAEVMSRYSECATAFYDDSLHMAPPSGETGLQVLSRVLRFVKEQFFLSIRDHTELTQTVVVVTHGGPLRLLLATLMYNDPTRHWEINVDHGSIVRCAVSDKNEWSVCL